MRKKDISRNWLVLFTLFILACLPLGFILYQQMSLQTPTSKDDATVTPPEIFPPSAPFIGKPITLTGKMVCLPHKNAEGPQTMECAFGIQDAKGNYYGLRDVDPEMKNLSMIPMDASIEIQGSVIEEKNDIYPTSGVIEIQSFEVIQE